METAQQLIQIRETGSDSRELSLIPFQLLNLLDIFYQHLIDVRVISLLGFVGDFENSLLRMIQNNICRVLPVICLRPHLVCFFYQLSHVGLCQYIFRIVLCISRDDCVIRQTAQIHHSSHEVRRVPASQLRVRGV